MLVREEGFHRALKMLLGQRQPEQESKGFWNAKELDGYPTCGEDTCIASEALMKVETRMGSLCTREVYRRGARSRFPLDLYHHLLLSKQLHAGSTMLSPTPVSPQQRSRPDLKRM
jgi:hypothetical protein